MTVAVRWIPLPGRATSFPADVPARVDQTKALKTGRACAPVLSLLSSSSCLFVVVVIQSSKPHNKWTRERQGRYPNTWIDQALDISPWSSFLCRCCDWLIDWLIACRCPPHPVRVSNKGNQTTQRVTRPLLSSASWKEFESPAQPQPNDNCYN